jgi:branched-subunit amino acid transport protein
MQTVYMIAGMFLVTFSIRYILLPLSGRIRLSSGVQESLKYVPPAVLTAIIIPAVLLPDGHHLQFTATNPYLLGAICTALIGWFSKNLLLTIVGGMVAFAICQWALVLFY